MRRRALLAGIGSTIGLAGCLSSPGSDGDDPGTTITPIPPQRDPPPCPEYGDGAVVCGPGDGASMAMVPSHETASLPRARVDFTLTNARTVRFTTNFYAWKLHKWVDGD